MKIRAWCIALALSAVTPAWGLAADGDKACGLLSLSELERALGTHVSLSGGAAAPLEGVDLCTGATSNATVLLRLSKGLDPGRDRSDGTEGKGIEMVKKMGAQVDVRTFGPITCSTMVPSAALVQYGFNTTCTVSKPTVVAGIEVTTKSREDMVSIEQLHPLAEKMADRF